MLNGSITFILDFLKFLDISTPSPTKKKKKKKFDCQWPGHTMKSVMERLFNRAQKTWEMSSWFHKKTVEVYRALFSCQERCLWKWHVFHRKLWDSRACIAPRRHMEILGAIRQWRNNHLLVCFFRNIYWCPLLFQWLFQVWRI
jgi:hypothetical protein